MSLNPKEFAYAERHRRDEPHYTAAQYDADASNCLKQLGCKAG